ncbi:MAG: hypothetical protein IJN16_03090 [Lachnospiraceae bacterium]|nr:hypothetical protein [Lachnospiraceae bacterium]
MFAKSIKISALVWVVLTIVFSLLYRCSSNAVILSMAITFGTIGYHFLMRLAVGYVINGLCHNCFDYKKAWFQEKSFEKRLYEKLGVKKWKDKMPTFAPEMLDLKIHTWEEILGAMCQAEVVHSVIIVLCFVPLLATFMWGAFWVFFITSVLSASVEMVFVIMQRYNRPRIIRMMEKENRRKGEKL